MPRILAFYKPLGGGRRVPPAAVVVLLASLATTASAQSTPPGVTVHEQRGTYSVVARFAVEQPPAVALMVLTDYEHIPPFHARRANEHGA